MQHQESPTQIGWYNTAGVGCQFGYYRWWNGFHWSKPAYRHNTREEAAYKAKWPSAYRNDEIRWKEAK